MMVVFDLVEDSVGRANMVVSRNCHEGGSSNWYFRTVITYLKSTCLSASGMLYGVSVIDVVVSCRPRL